jgi:hypothetical protein
LIDENNLNVFSKPFIEKCLHISDPEEHCYVKVLNNIKKKLKRHLKETRRVNEIFIQLDTVIKVNLQQRVREFIGEDRREP